MAVKTAKRRTFTEAVISQGVTVDREEKVIRGVRVLGLESKNGRVYTVEAAREAIPFYEGIEVNIDHLRTSRQQPPVERSIRDRWAILREVQWDSDGQGLTGNLHYLESHPMTPQLLEMAERFPDKFGLSHDAYGDSEMRGGVEVVTKIEGVRSVDVVGRPATTKGLFESEDEVLTVAKKTTVRKLFEAHAKNAIAKQLLEGLSLVEDIGSEIGDMAMEAPEVSSDPSSQIGDAFKQAVMGILDREDLDLPGKMAAIKQLLNAKSSAEAAMNQAPPAAEPPMTEGEGEPMKESEELKTLRAEVRQLREQRERDELHKKCTRLLESAGREVSDVRLAAMMTMTDDKMRKQLVESWPAKQVATGSRQRPAASPPAEFKESADASYPADVKEFAKALR